MIRSALSLILFLLGLLLAQAAHAASFSLRTGDNAAGTQSMSIDSNKCATSGPRAAYVGGVISAGAAAETNVTVSISGLGNGFFLAGGQQASQSIGTLAAGASTGVYWFIGYSCTVNASTSPTITVTSSAGTTTKTLTLTARSAISANAGGNVTGSLLGPGAVVGQTIWFDASYSFGNIAVADEFFLQPSGGQNFDALCFRLVGTEITASNVTGVPAGTLNQLYFVSSVQQSGNGYTATVRYFFEYQCAGASTTTRPYAIQTSGNTNLKYTGNFDGTGSVTISFPTATNPFTITKTQDRSWSLAGAATVLKYTVTVSNPSTNDSRISRIVDTLPSGAIFQSIHADSQVTVANSSSVPSAGASGTISFVGRQDVSYMIPAGGSVTLVYTVTMPTAAGAYTNSAAAYFGSATTPTASATFNVYTPVPLTMVKSSQAAWDPFNLASNAKAIPGGRVDYAVLVSNPAGYPIDANSIVITDPTPANLRLFVNALPGTSAPIVFQNGSPASGLTFTFTSLASTTDDVDFSSDGGATWTYVPAPDGSGADPLVTHIRIRPKGTMNANSNFTLRFGYLVQ